jgi:hypothetical protein
LPDLLSCLTWVPSYRLQPLGEQDCEDLLRVAATRRGLPLGENLVDYLMRRLAPDAGSLLAFQEALDRKSLIDRRAPSIPLARRGWNVTWIRRLWEVSPRPSAPQEAEHPPLGRGLPWLGLGFGCVLGL